MPNPIVDFALFRNGPYLGASGAASLTNFEPTGPTANPQIPHTQSLGDYIGRWLASQFCTGQLQAELGIRSADAASPPAGALSLFRGRSPPRRATPARTAAAPCNAPAPAKPAPAVATTPAAASAVTGNVAPLRKPSVV